MRIAMTADHAGFETLPWPAVAIIALFYTAGLSLLALAAAAAVMAAMFAALFAAYFTIRNVTNSQAAAAGLACA